MHKTFFTLLFIPLVVIYAFFRQFFLLHFFSMDPEPELLLIFNSSLHSLVSFEEAVLNPPLDCIARYRNHYHYSNKFNMRMTMEWRKYFYAEVKNGLAVLDLKKEYNDLAEEHNHDPYKHL